MTPLNNKQAVHGLPKPHQYFDFRWSVPSGLRSDDARPFVVQMPIEKAWQQSPHRILVVFESVDADDLRNKRLLSGPSAAILKSIREIGLEYGRHVIKKPHALAVCNFNYFRTAHLTGSYLDMARSEAGRRVHAIIKRLKPHTVFVIGANAAVHLTGQDPTQVFYNQGRVRVIDGVRYVTTVDISSSYQGKKANDEDEDGEDSEQKIGLANLIGFMGRCFGNALAERPVYRIDFKVKSKVIDTIEEFRRFYAFLMKQDRVAVDTETLNLYRKKNKLLTIQFAFNGNVGYMIPMGHQDAPWSPEEYREIHQCLRKFFMRKFDYLADNRNCFLLGQNLKFDATIIRETFKINTLQWPLIDTMALMYLLDINMSAVRLQKQQGGKKGAGAYGLLWQTKWLDCDFYTDNAFGKDDRFNIANLELSTPGLIDYCCADVQILWHILAQYRMQARNRKTMLLGKTYYDVWWKFAATQMSSMIHVLSHMEHRGDPLDVEWLKVLLRRDGPLHAAYIEKTQEFRKFESVRAVNQKLLEASGTVSDDMFGGEIWEFSITRPAHKQKLFIDQLELEPLQYSRKTKNPVLDKKFQEQYKDVPEVALFNELSQIDKLIGTYVNGFWKRFKTSADMVFDNCLRASFGFLLTTGRSNSYDPNLQNLPQHGKFATLIKRMFAAPQGYLIVKEDFSANEVRCWGIISGDQVLCSLFVNGRWLRQQFRLSENPVFSDLMETVGDVHKINCQFFFRVDPADVTKEQRNSVKSIVFGAIYGRGAKAIAQQAKSTKEAIAKLMVKFFERFRRASAWLEKAKKDAITIGFSYGPSGRIRDSYCHLTGIDNFIAAAERRGANAPVQGHAADWGHMSAYMYEIHLEKVCRMFKLDTKPIMDCGVNSFVHDAIKSVTPYHYVLVAAQIMQWVSTIGVCQYYKTHFGIKFYVEPEVDVEFAAHDAEHYKWTWDDTSLRKAIRSALEDQKTYCPNLDIDAAEAEVWSVRDNKPLMDYLNKHYPILDNWPDAKHLEPEQIKKELGAAIEKQTKQIRMQGNEAVKYLRNIPGVPAFIQSALDKESDKSKHESMAKKLAMKAINKARAMVAAQKEQA